MYSLSTACAEGRSLPGCEEQNSKTKKGFGEHPETLICLFLATVIASITKTNSSNLVNHTCSQYSSNTKHLQVSFLLRVFVLHTPHNMLDLIVHV